MSEGELRAALKEALRSSLYDRGNNVREWPADEAAAYRDNGGWQEGSEAALSLRYDKAVQAVMDVLGERR